MPFRSRSFSRMMLLAVALALVLGPIGCASPKPRDKWWQFWRKKKPEAPSIYHPDRMFLPPQAELGEGDEPGVAIPLGPDGLMPPEQLTELSYLPEPEPLRLEAEQGVLELRTVHFAFDSAELSPEAQQTLERNLEWLRRNPGVQLQVEGHTDERGTNEYNMLLGERRAKSVKAYLVGRGIPDSNLHVISYGEERPLDPGKTDEAYAQNRRAQFLVY
jgi:peptidoglycan-associated lipoprotein